MPRTPRTRRMPTSAARAATTAVPNPPAHSFPASTFERPSGSGGGAAG